MNKKLTFEEAVRISFQREWEIGNPKRITQLIFGTIYYSAVYYVGLPIVRAWLYVKAFVKAVRELFQ